MLALKAIPGWALVIGVLILALCAGVTVQTIRLSESKAEYAQYVATVATESEKSEKVARETERKHQNDIDEARNDAQKQKVLDDARIAQLAATGDSMRKQVGGLLADKSALNSRLAARGKTINDLTDLLAKLRQQADDYAGELAGQLDASRRAGFTCERAYDAIAGKK
ncbi:DUF2514 family protein [Pseudomonas sp. MONT-RG-20F-20-E-7-02]|uniref:DUF2514 family protein n=1 Tax=Pseudomonas sp. MONT-RG-20F-20-E-7-02 TaxID=2914979 RepID=UPI001F5925ED|nr:DUF2514 family protein [Pseudomonas sp. MONT-RG-20F-20-E-7-02]